MTNSEAVKVLKAALIENENKGAEVMKDIYPDGKMAKENLEKIETLTEQSSVSDVMRVCRDMAWDLQAFIRFAAEHLDDLDKDIEHGSYQDTERVQIAQLVKFYGVDIECFYGWCT